MAKTTFRAVILPTMREQLEARNGEVVIDPNSLRLPETLPWEKGTASNFHIDASGRLVGDFEMEASDPWIIRPWVAKS